MQHLLKSVGWTVTAGVRRYQVLSS